MAEDCLAQSATECNEDELLGGHTPGSQFIATSAEELGDAGLDLVESSSEVSIEAVSGPGPGFLAKVAEFIMDAIDFVKTANRILEEASEIGANVEGSFEATASSMAALEPLILNSVSGTIYSGSVVDGSWSLYDLSINVDIAKDYYSNLSLGSLAFNRNTFDPNAIGYGVFSVQDFVDPPGYNTVSLSLRQLEVLQTTVPEPSSLVLFGFGIGGMLVVYNAKRRRRPPISLMQ